MIELQVLIEITVLLSARVKQWVTLAVTKDLRWIPTHPRVAYGVKRWVNVTSTRQW